MDKMSTSSSGCVHPDWEGYQVPGDAVNKLAEPPSPARDGSILLTDIQTSTQCVQTSVDNLADDYIMLGGIPTKYREWSIAQTDTKIRYRPLC